MEQIAPADRTRSAADPAGVGSCPLGSGADMWPVGAATAALTRPSPARTTNSRARMRSDRGARTPARAWVVSLVLHGALFLGAAFALEARPPRSAPLRTDAHAGISAPETRLEPELPEPPPEFVTPPEPEVPVEEPLPELPVEPPPPKPPAPDLEEEPLVDLEPAALPVPTLTPPLTNRRLKSRHAEPAPAAPAAPAPPPSSAPPTAPVGPPLPGALRGTALPDPPYVAALAGVRHRLTAHLLLRLDAEGRVVDATVERTSGLLAFDEHARTWVLARWRFAPPGRAVRTRVPVHFIPR